MPVPEVTRTDRRRIWQKYTAERIKKAQDKALERLDYILETVSALDFVEVVGRVGGDVVTYRVYNDGSVCEK